MKHTIVTLLISCSALFASIGEVTAIRGTAKLQRGDTVTAVHAHMKLEKHDILHTGQKSKMQIVFNDKTVISLGQNSRMRVDEYIFDKKQVEAHFSVTKGFFKSITGKIGKIAPDHFKVKTANATIGVRGTTIIGEVTPKFDIIACTYGQIVVSTPYGSVVVDQGERTVVRQTKPPKEAEKTNPVIMKKLDEQSDIGKMPENTSPQSKAVETIPAPLSKKSENNDHDDVTQKKETAQKEETVSAQEPSQSDQSSTTDDTTDEETNQEQPPASDDSQTDATKEVQQINSLDDIRRIIGTQNPLYQGKITNGTTSFGTIKENEINDVQLRFDLGSGALDGHLKFEDNIRAYNIDIGGHIRDDATFNFNSQNGYNGGGSGALHGEQLQNADGTFDFTENDIHTDQVINHIEGEFEARRR